jgi:hypothetical protein
MVILPGWVFSKYKIKFMGGFLNEFGSTSSLVILKLARDDYSFACYVMPRR